MAIDQNAAVHMNIFFLFSHKTSSECHWTCHGKTVQPLKCPSVRLVSRQLDQSSLGALLKATDWRLLQVDREDTGQAALMCRLICVFAGYCLNFFLTLSLIFMEKKNKNTKLSPLYTIPG